MQRGILWIGSILLFIQVLFAQVIGGIPPVEPITDIDIVLPLNNYNYTELNVSFYVVSNITNIYGYLNGQLISINPNSSSTLYSSYGINTFYVCYMDYMGEHCENVNYTVFYPPFVFSVNTSVYSDRTSFVFQKLNDSFTDVSIFVLGDDLMYYDLSQGNTTLLLENGANDFTLFYICTYEGQEYTFKQDFRVFSFAPTYYPSYFYMYDVSSIFGFIKYELSKRTFLGVSTVFVIVSGLFMILLYVQMGDFSSKFMMSSFICAVVYMLLAALFGIYSSEFFVFIIFTIIGSAMKFFGS